MIWAWWGKWPTTSLSWTRDKLWNKGRGRGFSLSPSIRIRANSWPRCESLSQDFERLTQEQGNEISPEALFTLLVFAERRFAPVLLIQHLGAGKFLRRYEAKPSNLRQYSYGAASTIRDRPTDAGTRSEEHTSELQS